jgi:VWFA-related protein
MKLHVAYRLRVVLSLLSVTTLFVSTISAQTTKRSTGKRSTNNARAATASRDGTLIICQGVPVPSGYAIIAYLTSTACPHGAYVLKKQDPYSESVAARYAKRNQSTTATQAGDTDVATSNSSGTSQTPPSTATPAATSGARTNSVDPFVTAPPRKVTSSQPVASTPQPKSTASTQSADPGSRPRRVAVSASRDDIAIVEDPPERPALAPRWAGTPPTASPSAASAAAVIDPGPEEVAEGDVVRVNTSLVTVPVSVLDRQGRFIPDLQREDFRVFENGVEQAVAYWEPADKPFTVALLLDTSPSTAFHLWQIKEAAIAFAKQLRPQDRVLIVSFNDQVLLLTEVTNDMNVVSAVIEQNANMGNATRLYDAVHLVIKERLNKIKGRKAIVVFTDGVDTASFQANYASTMREVEELDALIYPIQYDTTDYLRAMQSVGQGSTTVVTTTSNGPFGIGTTTSRVTYGTPRVTGPNGGPLPGATQADYDRANQYLKELADKTAGRLYHANDTTQLAEAFSRIAEELRRQYSLGYYPQDGDASAAARRQIKVRVNRPNLAVKARDSSMFTTPPSVKQ